VEFAAGYVEVYEDREAEGGTAEEMKPYYEHAGVTIYHGDCKEVLPTLGVQAIVTDPPYGISYVKGKGGRGKHNRRNVEPIAGDSEPFEPKFLLGYASVLCWGADHYAQRLPEGRWLVWDKLNGLESFDSFSDVEIAWFNKKGASRIFRYLWKGICQDGDKDIGRVHPTQKPLALMKWCFSFIPDDELVCDPFMGSGTTLRAAKDLGRRAIGIELEEKYCEIAAERMSQEVFEFEAAS
jgi:site-specific DNA-methyltransferase (adenine-specific)